MLTGRRIAKTAAVIVATAAFVAIAFAIISAFQAQQAASRRTATKDDLKRIMIAMHQYHDEYNSFPPAFVVGPDGKRWHSWRALILPYLEPELARQYRFDEPWNGPHNSTLLPNAPEAFRSDCVNSTPGATNYFAVVGKRTLWPADQSLGFRDIMDGTSNTLAVVEDSRSDVEWLEPADLLPGEFFHSFYHGEPWTKSGGRTVGLADGSARYLSPKLNRTVLSGLLTPSMSSDTYKGDNWPADLIDAIAEQKLRLPVDAENLTKTTICAAASEEISTDRNQLWAATFQMAWDQLKEDVSGPVQLSRQIPMLVALNAGSFDLSSLSPGTSFAARTGVSSQEDAELLGTLKERFPDVDPPLHPMKLKSGQWGIRLYALIRKKMPFESLFDRFQTPLEFLSANSTIRVNSFGQDPKNSQDGNPTFAAGQVEILDDRGDNDFIVQLNSAGREKDEIILALVPAESSLDATWNSVQERIRRPNPQHNRRTLDGNETLQIPILDFSIQKHFSAIEGQSIEGFGGPAILTLAFIDMRLRLDETGAEFQSAAEAGVIGEFGEAEEYKPDRIRRLILNRSFFVAMKERDGKQPWFLGWIANEELMESFDSPTSVKPIN